MEKDVQEWDMSSYPDIDPRDGKAGSTWFKLQYLTKDGMVDAKTFKTTMPMNILNGQGVIETVNQVIEKKGGRREWAVTGGIGSAGAKKDWQGQPASKIESIDLKKAEQEIQGKPTVVLMGLFWKASYTDSGELIEWVPQDRKKTILPLYWRDVTEEYYAKWRPEAYKTGVDPYKGMQRPYTKMQEVMANTNEKDRKIAELEERLRTRK